MKKFTQTLLVVFMAVALFGTANGQTVTNQYYNVTSGNGYGLRFWSSNNYKVHMGNSSYYKYGPVQDYSIKMTMNNDADRGWTWGVLNTAPKAALSTQGTFQLAKDLKVMGNTGIGTADPNSRLHVNASSGQVGLRVQISGSSKFTVASNGGATIGAYNNTPPANGLYVNGSTAIGTSDPGGAKLKVYGSSNPSFEFASSVSRLQIGAATSGWAYAHESKAGDIVFRPLGGNDNHHGMIFYLPNDNNDGNSYIKFGDDKNNLWMGIFNNKMVRIDGKLYAKEMRCRTNVWSDFVFHSDYELKSLDEVESFINKNNHLPDVPNEATVMEEGIDVGEMNAILLQKIEELTLYMIEQNKTIKDLQNEVNNLKN
ncbi:MAG: hypothetical protein PHY85_03820 [Bacteroidales bacterium]|nr:hypothetical protein [Bacteroidales bacterium]